MVPDLTKNPDFCNDAWLTDRGILFFAGVPVQSEAENVVGILCVIDTRPREMSDQDLAFLDILARVFMQKLTAPEAKDA